MLETILVAVLLGAWAIAEYFVGINYILMGVGVVIFIFLVGVESFLPLYTRKSRRCKQ